MKLPLSLIKSFISLDLSVEKIADTLTLLGIEVDAIHAPYPLFNNVVVAEVKAVQRHPAADRLQVAQVFDGTHTYQVVCGAPNCRAQLRVALAKVGATLTDETGKTRSIAQTSIRGVESLGMLCSASELCLYEDQDGILELPSDFSLGDDCASLLWDPVFELSLTPNLGHCMSALGIARELSAALQRPLKLPKISSKKRSGELPWKISQREHCPRYTARMIQQVRVQPSPFWLQKQLRAAGLRPINNIVDATNYILLKNGQPMHAFDAKKIEGSSLKITAADVELSFEGLDGNTYKAPAGTLLISDAKKPIALAGIMGGLNSAVSDSTHTVLLEAACFDALAIRIGSKKIGLRTESSLRFEKGIDPSAVAIVLDEAAALIAELSGGKVAPGKIDAKEEKFTPRKISFRPQRVDQILGMKLSASEIKNIFHRLGLHVLSTKQIWSVEIPLYRGDLQEEIDLIEEVARIYGYNHIERALPKATTAQIPHDKDYLFEQELRRRLVSLGLQEFLTCDLISPKLTAIAQEFSLAKITLLKTLHSKSEEYSILRPSLLPGLLQVIRTNLDQKNPTFSAFELGRIHFLQEEKPVEFLMAAILLTGKESPHHWDRKPNSVDFFDLKGLLENLLQGLRLHAFTIVPSEHLTFHPGRQANIFIGNLCIGCFGELHPSLLFKQDIKQRVYYAEINAHYLQQHCRPTPKMIPLAQFPSSERDWTLSLNPKTAIASLFQAIDAAKPPLLEKFELIDLYRAQDKNNVTFRFAYRDLSKTVSFEEVEETHGRFVQEVSKTLNTQ